MLRAGAISLFGLMMNRAQISRLTTPLNALLEPLREPAAKRTSSTYGHDCALHQSRPQRSRPPTGICQMEGEYFEPNGSLVVWYLAPPVLTTKTILRAGGGPNQPIAICEVGFG